MSKEARFSLALVLDSLAASNYAPAMPATKILVKLCSVNTKRVDEMDYDMIIPALNSLGNPSDSLFWSNFVQVHGDSVPAIFCPWCKLVSI